MTVLVGLYPWIKALHVIAVIAWMAGLFYLPRLFVYHAESVTRGTETDTLFQTMERKLLKLIMTPSMIVTWIFGLMLVSIPGVVDWSEGWPWLKAVAVIGMTAFHGWCAGQRKRFAGQGETLTGRRYRLMNEVPTLFLLVIVVAVIVKPF
ncbi:protoporphyrinogen oxidase HemJ [Anianabacter salinae]|uniref:protoporphyrinogen oxidase HemJ n=1 Tax=Anianabacter salinae TaxID=2851023 RepID=UPI00225E2CF3|nr:protoporphyrinogen oxidase HemJ [Anianabacter salinae]MBV0913513.1 protoporphyrinogen oxidase HemJ [Anianabacter salinae]